MQAQQEKQLRSLQLIALIIGLALMGVKMVAWWVTGSNAILSDALESIINIVAGGFGWYSLLLAAKPKDANHPYGHGKIEFLSAGFEGALITIAGIAIIAKGIYNFFYPQQLEFLRTGAYLTAFSGAVNYLMGWKLEHEGEKAKSLILKASGKHLQSDAWSSLGILMGLALVIYTQYQLLDNILAIFFGAMIIYTGFGLIRRSVAGVMDEADPALIKALIAKIQENRSPNWIDIHNFRVITYGRNLHIDCHLTLPWYLNTEASHAEVKKLEMQSRNFGNFPVEWFIHVDPCKPSSCHLCSKDDCAVRQHPFEKQVEWTLENVMINKPH
jgi:cation diffusion facilitator family transporter